jgi:DNA modification methylase
MKLRNDEEEKKSRESIIKESTFQYPENKREFTFYQKSSDKMDEILDSSVQCIFTSPPYALGIRNYSNKVVLGSESSVEEYSENLSNHLLDCERILSEKGSFFLNLGDVYDNGILQCAPHKVLFKLLEKTNFKLRSTIIFKKSNPKPTSYKTRRNTSSTEFIFHLVKNMDYDFEQVLLPLSENTKPSHPPRHRTKKGDNSVELIVTSVANQSLNYGNDHPAMYHPSLVTIPLLQICVMPFLNSIERCDISHRILDPFAGGLNTYKSMKWINETFGTNLEFIGYDLKKYF